MVVIDSSYSNSEFKIGGCAHASGKPVLHLDTLSFKIRNLREVQPPMNSPSPTKVCGCCNQEVLLYFCPRIK